MEEITNEKSYFFSLYKNTVTIDPTIHKPVNTKVSLSCIRFIGFPNPNLINQATQYKTNIPVGICHKGLFNIFITLFLKI